MIHLISKKSFSLIVAVMKFLFLKHIYYGCGDGYAFVANFVKIFKNFVNTFKP
jgi:hypothetical protein